MNSTWRKLWADYVAGRDFQGFHTSDFAVVSYNVSLGKNMEVNNENVEQLEENHENERSMEELEQCQELPQKAIVDKMSFKKKERRENVPCSLKFVQNRMWCEVS